MLQTNERIRSKSKILAFLLSITLGFLGFHNFYLRRWKRGFIQFFLVIFTFGVGSLITFPWAFGEGFLILIGRYSLIPPQLRTGDVDQKIAESEESKINPIKEYILVALLLSPLMILSIPTFGIPLLFAAIFYFLVGGLWNVITRLFIKSVLPIYASVFGGGKKFLIRFSEYSLPPVGTRAGLLKATRKLSLTAIFVLFFLISLIAQGNTAMVTEGERIEAYICDDGTFSLYSCDDGSVGTVCDSSCVMENTEALDRLIEAYATPGILIVLMFAPFITVLIAPILVLTYSSLSIVDKNTRSISPIGEKANDLTNIGAGFGSVVLFFQTAWNISSSAAENGNMMTGIGYVAFILLWTLLLVAMFYPLIWLPMLKFSKAFESHVFLLDDSLVASKGIEVHQLTYLNNELRITPMKDPQVSINMSSPLQYSAPPSTPPPSSPAPSTPPPSTPPPSSPAPSTPPPSTPPPSSPALSTLPPSTLPPSTPPPSTPPPSTPMPSFQPPVPLDTNPLVIGPKIEQIAQSTDEHGYEWINYEGADYYRPVGQKIDWKEYR